MSSFAKILKKESKAKFVWLQSATIVTKQIKTLEFWRDNSNRIII